MKLIFDMEGNGLHDEITRVHCICVLDLDTNKKPSFDTDRSNINDGLGVLMAADTLIGHNIIAYDLRVLNKLYPWFKIKPETKIIDTYVLSSLLRPERWGGHGLESWGERAKRKKPEHEDWSVFSPEMLHRCQEDVEINLFTYNCLMAEAYEQIEGVPYGKIFTEGI